MRLRDLQDVFLGQDIYIVGAGPSINFFPMEFLQDKICISLNDTYKRHPAISPIAFMHHESYARTSDAIGAPLHPNFRNLKYPIAKASGKVRLPGEIVDWENPDFYFFEWSHDIKNISNLTKETDVLYYTPEGCSQHAALQIAWLMGAQNIFCLGCDSRPMGGKHYADYDKNGIRAAEVLAGPGRNYDSYVYGSLIVQDFLAKKGVNVFNLSNIIGFHMVDFQYDVLSGKKDLVEVHERVKSAHRADQEKALT